MAYPHMAYPHEAPRPVRNFTETNAIKTPAYERLSYAGRIVADMFTNRSSVQFPHQAYTRTLLKDYNELDTIIDMGGILQKINSFGGIVTVHAQTTVPLYSQPEKKSYKRPYISLLAHTSLAPLFKAIGMQDHISVFGTQQGLQPISFTCETENRGDIRQRDHFLYSHGGMCMCTYENLNHVIRSDTIIQEYFHTVQELTDLSGIVDPVFALEDAAEMMAVDIAWTRTVDVGDFVRTLEPFFATTNNHIRFYRV